MTLKTLLAGAALSLMTLCAQAHYTLVVPNHATVVDQKEAKLDFLVGFSHPMQQHAMPMVKPEKAFVAVGDSKESLLERFKPSTLFGKPAWTFDYKITRPRIYQFAVQSKPYWEAAEDQWIKQYSKVMVPAFGEEMGWGKPLGLTAEIVPYTRPWGNWVGNTFEGQVLYDGKPVPHALIAIQYLNKDGKRTVPNAYYSPQLLTADERGVFSYSVPWEGWWVFGAFLEAPYKLDKDGVAKPVEVAALIWSEFHAPMTKK